jgi:hypothetical protein
MARARPLTAALWPRPYGSRPGAACVGCGRHLVLATVVVAVLARLVLGAEGIWCWQR